MHRNDRKLPQMHLFLMLRIQHHRMLTLCCPKTYTQVLGVKKLQLTLLQPSNSVNTAGSNNWGHNAISQAGHRWPKPVLEKALYSLEQCLGPLSMCCSRFLFWSLTPGNYIRFDFWLESNNYKPPLYTTNFVLALYQAEDNSSNTTRWLIPAK